MRTLTPTLDAALSALGATQEEKASLVGFLENQVASASGRANGLAGSIDDLTRQKGEAEVDVARLTVMLEKFTDAAPDPLG